MTRPSDRVVQALLVLAFGMPGVIVVVMLGSGGAPVMTWLLGGLAAVAVVGLIWWKAPWNWIVRTVLTWLWLSALLVLGQWLTGGRGALPLIGGSLTFGALWSGLLLLPVSFVTVIQKASRGGR
ncbi:hypothetical protein [Granulicoccus sp. GXG6511]|uniref:hypothetical protein n=1 Tax=Granulicoccus sp. GXG6511 TaxID=3381351 RepID=UPI003D7EBE1C